MAMEHISSPPTMEEMLEDINRRDEKKLNFVIEQLISKIYYAKSNSDFSLDVEDFLDDNNCTRKILLDSIEEANKLLEGYNLEVDGAYIILTKFTTEMLRPYER